MKTIDLEARYPGLEVRGRLYDDPNMQYISGDVFYVKLPNGFVIDVGWDDEDTESTGPFRIVVYKRYYGNMFSVACEETVDEVLATVDSFIEVFREHVV